MPRITELWAYVLADSGPDDEGITAFKTNNNEWLPMVGADAERAESLRPIAQRLATVNGKAITLLRFTNREEMGTILPTPMNAR